jgi:acyl dehydratase
MDDSSVYFEDLAIGAAFVSDEEPVDPAEMLAYARRNDPWPFHIEEASAAAQAYGGVIASGGYTITLMYRLGHRIYNVPGRRWAVIGALGWQVKFPLPLRQSDRVHLRITVQDKRASSRSERGHFDLLYELLNQHDALVLSMLMAGLIARRPVVTQSEIRRP